MCSLFDVLVQCSHGFLRPFDFIRDSNFTIPVPADIPGAYANYMRMLRPWRSLVIKVMAQTTLRAQHVSIKTNQ